MNKHFLSVCAALFALMILFPVTTHAADVYAILYDDGTFVFQHGNTPESGKTVMKTYEIDPNAVYVWDDDAHSADTPWYNERESVHVVNFADKISPTATACWLCDCKNLKRVENIQNLDTSNATSMASMFDGCENLTALDVSHFDTVNVTDMQNMFCNCSELTALDVSRFDTANVTDMCFMFYNCSGLTTLDVSHFNTANVTKMHFMFYNCGGLTTLDVSHFDTANVTDMWYMFYCCKGLTALDVSHFNTANVTEIDYMFSGCGGLTALDISNFDTAKVKNMRSMFSDCYNLKTIYASEKFTTASVIESSTYGGGKKIFDGCTSLVGGNGTKFDASHTDKIYARIDTPSAPGYFTNFWDVVKSHIITAYVGEGGTVTPSGDCRVRAGDSQKYVMTPNPGYRVRSVSVDGVDIGAVSEYVFQNVIRDHTLFVSFEPLPRYAITAAAHSNGQLSVTLTNTAPVTVAVSYFDQSGKFLSADLKSVSADVKTVTFPQSAAHRARVALLDSDCRPLCDAVTVS